MSTGITRVFPQNLETWRCPPGALALWISRVSGRVLAYANPPTGPFGFLGTPPIGALLADFFPPEIASAVRAALRAEGGERSFALDDPRSGWRTGHVTVEAADGEVLVLLEAETEAEATRVGAFALVVTREGKVVTENAPAPAEGVALDLLHGSAATAIADGDLRQRALQLRGRLGEQGPTILLSPLVPGATSEPLRTALAAEGIGAHVRFGFRDAGENYVAHALARTAEPVGPAVRQHLLRRAVAEVAAAHDAAAREFAGDRERTGASPSGPAVSRDAASSERQRRHTLPYAPSPTRAAESAGATAGDAPPRPSGVLPRPTAITVALIIGDCRDLPASLEGCDWVVVRVRDSAAATAIAAQLRFDLCLLGDRAGSSAVADLAELQLALRARAAEIPIWQVGTGSEHFPGIPFRSDQEVLAFAGGLPNARAAR